MNSPPAPSRYSIASHVRRKRSCCYICRIASHRVIECVQVLTHHRQHQQGGVIFCDRGQICCWRAAPALSPPRLSSPAAPAGWAGMTCQTAHTVSPAACRVQTASQGESAAICWHSAAAPPPPPPSAASAAFAVSSTGWNAPTHPSSQARRSPATSSAATCVTNKPALQLGCKWKMGTGLQVEMVSGAWSRRSTSGLFVGGILIALTGVLQACCDWCNSHCREAVSSARTDPDKTGASSTSVHIQCNAEPLVRAQRRSPHLVAEGTPKLMTATLSHPGFVRRQDRPSLFSWPPADARISVSALGLIGQTHADLCGLQLSLKDSGAREGCALIQGLRRRRCCRTLNSWSV